MPRGSPTVATSGGSVQPVSHGEIARTIHPDGAIRNARPIASAECGVARIGASQRADAPHPRPAVRPARRTRRRAPAPATRVDDAGEQRDRDAASRSPGYATSARHGVEVEARGRRSRAGSRTRAAACRRGRRRSAAGTRRPSAPAAQRSGSACAARRSLRVPLLPFGGDARHPRRMRLEQRGAELGVGRQRRRLAAGRRSACAPPAAAWPDRAP